jgi:nicotinate phosphoribosyltransferase
MKNRKFLIATEKEIQEGSASDVYFSRNMNLVLEKEDQLIVAEITTSSAESWINFTGLIEALNLLENKKLNLWALPEGTIIPPKDSLGRNIPFLVIKGKYSDIMEFETSLLGFLCQSSGISTESSKVFMECFPIPFLSFGIRRMHPGISPMIDRAAYIGGASGVSGILGGEVVGISPSGTMPHSIALLMGEERAWKYIVDNFPEGSRTLLIDTFGDEKFKAIEVAEKFPDIDFIRLDTPSSRRGNFSQIIREIRWELDIRGHKNIKIMVSGGIRRDQIKELKEAGVNSFGIGTSIVSGKVIDFAMDIVEINGKAITKRGKFSGMKNIYKCEQCGIYKIGLFGTQVNCHKHGSMQSLLVPFIKDGKLIADYDSVKIIRERSVKELQKLIEIIKE